jgi:flagellar protein FlbD
MIRLTRLNHKPLIINADLIEHIDTTPDTVLSLLSGQTFVVRESAEEVVERVVSYRRALMQGLLTCTMAQPSGEQAGVAPADSPGEI